MKSLETKIPPPILAFIVILVMIWSNGGLHMPVWPLTAAAVLLWAAGIGMIAAAGREFRRAGTTPDPTNPDKASSILTTGIFGVTRNPMYVSLITVMLGLAFFLSSIWALAGPLVFALYIGRFQIEPEERVLAAKFGAEYEQYKTRVRRWL